MPKVSPKPNPYTTVTPLSKALALVLFISLPFLGFYLGFKYQNQFSTISNTNSKETLVTSCPISFTDNIDSLLRSYEVKAGDTLLSISKNQLGSTNRVEELIVMNANKYTSLSLEKPFLEQGWILKLPPQWVKSSSGQLNAINGKILKIRPNDQIFEITSGGVAGHFATITLDSNTINIKNTVFKEGDCISAIRDTRMNKILKIDLQ